jgi:ketosteroid isomerase-like protein
MVMRATHEAVARAVIAAVSRRDVASALAGVHPELVFELPYEPAVPTLDRAGYADLLAGLVANFRRLDFTVLEAIPGLDPALLVLRYQLDAESPDGAVSYRNGYLGILRFADGLIRHWTEYANPVLSRRMNERLAAVRVRSRTDSGPAREDEA